MAVILGKLALSLDVGSNRTILPDRKARTVAVEAVLNLNSLPRRSEAHALSAFAGGKGLESDGEIRTHRSATAAVVVRGKAKSKMNGVGSDAGSSDEDNGGEELWEENFDWEKEMRRRLKAIEERRELEKKAEELQSRMDDEEGGGDSGGGGGGGETEDEKRARVRKELEKVAIEQAERRETAQLMFNLGQKAYEKGMYGRSTEYLEGALTIIPKETVFGGEIQIWLAMAYEANSRHADCIALYKQLENTHPSISIKRQAANLRYILQAPKLKISQDEMVTIPLIGSSYDSYAATWSDKDKDKDRRSANQLNSSRDYLGDFLVWRPPVGLEKSQGFWVALALWFGLVGAALFIQR